MNSFRPDFIHCSDSNLPPLESNIKTNIPGDFSKMPAFNPALLEIFRKLNYTAMQQKNNTNCPSLADCNLAQPIKTDFLNSLQYFKTLCPNNSLPSINMLPPLPYPLNSPNCQKTFENIDKDSQSEKDINISFPRQENLFRRGPCENPQFSEKQKFYMNDDKCWNPSQKTAVLFKRGSLLRLTNGRTRRIEELRMEDFTASWQAYCNLHPISNEFRLCWARVTRIKQLVFENVENNKRRIKITFTVHPGRRRVNKNFINGLPSSLDSRLFNKKSVVSFESSEAQPYFVFAESWAAFNPNLCFANHGLICKRLELGDDCMILLKRSTHSPVPDSLIRPPVISNKIRKLSTNRKMNQCSSNDKVHFQNKFKKHPLNFLRDSKNVINQTNGRLNAPNPLPPSNWLSEVANNLTSNIPNLDISKLNNLEMNPHLMMKNLPKFKQLLDGGGPYLQNTNEEASSYPIQRDTKVQIKHPFSASYLAASHNPSNDLSSDTTLDIVNIDSDKHNS